MKKQYPLRNKSKKSLFLLWGWIGYLIYGSGSIFAKDDIQQEEQKQDLGFSKELVVSNPVDIAFSPKETESSIIEKPSLEWNGLREEKDSPSIDPKEALKKVKDPALKENANTSSYGEEG